MKFLFTTFLVFSFINFSIAQTKVSKLPEGTYQTYFYGYNYSLNKWLRGDIILLPGNTYKMSNEKVTGKYRFDEAKQRLYFLSGPLKNVYATTRISSHQPAIVLPRKENKEQNIDLAVSDIWAYYKK